MICVACRLGRRWECLNGGCGNNGETTTIQHISQAPSVAEEDEPREINTYKLDSALKDQQSTGRKRAAVMYPLDREAACDWKLQKNCGGGEHPIFGCASGKQEARHHGPDKNTLNNDQGNVHRICHQCHNRWHARNDEGYVWGAVVNPHSPTVANLQEVLLDDITWIGKAVKKAVD